MCAVQKHIQNSKQSFAQCTYTRVCLKKNISLLFCFYFQEKRSFKNAPCWIRILCIYAGTISGAFLAVTTLGVLHLQDLRQRCNPVGIERTQISEVGEQFLSQIKPKWAIFSSIKI